jgi:hypothetical protein
MGRLISDIRVRMSRQSLISKMSKKKPGPAPTGIGTPVLVRLHPPALTAVDEWAAQQEDHPTRPEAIRRMIEQVLGASKKKR